MRLAARTDANQEEIVKALRKLGARVQSLARMGEGVPDLLVGWRGRLLLLEVKDGSRKPSELKLTPAEEEWHARWAGLPVYVVESVEQAIATLGCYT